MHILAWFLLRLLTQSSSQLLDGVWSHQPRRWWHVLAAQAAVLVAMYRAMGWAWDRPHSALHVCNMNSTCCYDRL